MTLAEALIVEAVRARMLVVADRGRLRLKALAEPPRDLVERIKACKPDLLQLLSRHEQTEKVGDTSPRSPWSADELAVIRAAGAEPAALSAAAEVRAVFSDWGCRLMAVEPSSGRHGRPRRRVARAIREARRAGDRDAAVAARDCWAERMAICLEASDITEATAEGVALNDVLSFSGTADGNGQPTERIR